MRGEKKVRCPRVLFLCCSRTILQTYYRQKRRMFCIYLARLMTKKIASGKLEYYDTSTQSKVATKYNYSQRENGWEAERERHIWWLDVSYMDSQPTCLKTPWQEREWTSGHLISSVEYPESNAGMCSRFLRQEGKERREWEKMWDGA